LVHPNEYGILVNFHSHIYAGCRTRDGKTTVYLNSIIFNPSIEHDNTSIVFLAIVLAHELAHGIKRVTQSVANPKRSFFLERGRLPLTVRKGELKMLEKCFIAIDALNWKFFLSCFN
jgi:hypothetical protein